MDSRTFWTHWVIGFCAVIIWAWGDKLGVASTLQTYAAYTLPGLVGHAVGALRNRPANRGADRPAAPADQEPAPMQPEQPTTTQGSLT